MDSSRIKQQQQKVKKKRENKDKEEESLKITKLFGTEHRMLPHSPKI